MIMLASYWLEQTAADLPGNDSWLSRAERETYERLRVPKRRSDWLLGRWTAKTAAASWLRLPVTGTLLAALEIRPAPDGAPELFWNGIPGLVAISITHRNGIAACAVAPAAITLGCDLEVIEPRSDAFISDYFSSPEQELIDRSPAARFRLAALLWSAKESVLKALRMGLRASTPSVIIDPGKLCDAPNGLWQTFRARFRGKVFEGWWRVSGTILRTLAATPPISEPVFLPETTLCPHLS